MSTEKEKTKPDANSIKFSVNFKFSCPGERMKSVSLGVFLVFQAVLPERASQTRLGEQEDGEQHVTNPCATVDSMLRLLRTLAFCFWCVVLLNKQAVADEEALWGPTTSSENPPEKKQSSSWWPKLPSLPSLPSIPSIQFRIPFYGSSEGNDKAAAPTNTAKELTEPIDQLQDNSGSGDGSISDASEPPTTLAQGLLTSVTKIGTESLPTGTSDSPHGSTAQSHNDTLVSDSYSPTSTSIRNTLFTNSPTSTGTPEQNATHTHPPWGTVPAAGPSMGATTQHLPEERTDGEDFTEKSPSTIAPETTVPTALTWAATQTTTTIPGLVETALTSRPPPRSSETTSDRTPQDLPVSVTLHAGEATVTESHPAQSEADLGFSEARSGPVEEQPGVITTAMGIDRQLESITSTTESQRVNFPIAGGKQS